MKAKIKTRINILIGAILGLLGFSSCNTLVMYGVPSADLTFDSKVTNEAGEALENIQIVLRSGWQDDTKTIYWDRSDTLYTNADGTANRLYEGTFPLTLYRVIANDTTGVYVSDSIDAGVAFTGGDGSWNYGNGNLSVEFTLKKQNTDEQQTEED